MTFGLVAETATAGTLASAKIGPPAIDSELPQEPITALTFSFCTSTVAALAASTLSDLLSTATSWTFLPRTVGASLLASLMPSYSSAPPAPLAPVRGSKTPILITSPSPEEPEQPTSVAPAVSAAAMAR